jgi:2-iminobutanoate/2-iminopropanoate deaminase
MGLLLEALRHRRAASGLKARKYGWHPQERHGTVCAGLHRKQDNMRISRHWLPTFLVFAATLLPPTAGAAPRSYVDHKVPPGSPPLPFSDAVLSGDTLYVAGHLGIDPHTGSAPTDPALEAHLVMDAVKRTVESAGLGMDDLVSVTIYCTDLQLYDTFNTVYRTYFHGRYPARAFIGSNQLLRGAHFEVQGVATRAAP